MPGSILIAQYASPYAELFPMTVEPKHADKEIMISTSGKDGVKYIFIATADFPEFVRHCQKLLAVVGDGK